MENLKLRSVGQVALSFLLAMTTVFGFAQSAEAQNNPPRKVGIFTGSFDPAHFGHRDIVNGMKARFQLDEVIIVPDQSTRYKKMQPYALRKKMLTLLFKGDSGITVPTKALEAKLGSGEMWDVIEAVRSIHPDAQLFNIMGTDTFKWYSSLPENQIAKDVTILVNSRDRTLPIPTILNGNRVYNVELLDAGHSSTEVRRAFRTGGETPQITPAMRRFILENGLYESNSVAASVGARIRYRGELAPLPEAKPLLVETADLIESPAFKKMIATSPFLQRMQIMVKISLFHLNLKFEILDPKYPYQPPYKEPFPARPTLEAMVQAARFLELVTETTGFKTDLTKRLIDAPFYEGLQAAINAKQTEAATVAPKAYTRDEIIRQPVDTFIDMHTRIQRFGETAPMPEFESNVRDVLEDLLSPESRAFASRDRAFHLEQQATIEELRGVMKASSAATRLQREHFTPYPYRRTIQALDRGLAAIDMRIRATLPENEDWHKVELSHYVGNKPMLRPLYHTQRYKYEMFGLLANMDVVVLPFGDINQEELLRMRAAPWALIGVTTKVRRIDRFWHTPYEEWIHDVNHARRMYFYDFIKWLKLKIRTQFQKDSLFRQQLEFLDRVLAQTRPNTGNVMEDELRKIERVLLFETPHETATTPDAESFKIDLERGPRTPQPFERMRRGSQHVDLEADRTFDGNHISGALHHPLDLREPVTVERYMDRAQGFLTNVDNKLRVGFYDSPFDIDTGVAKVASRIPRMVARAAIRLARRMGFELPKTEDALTAQIEDRSGQVELDAYYGLTERDAAIRARVKAEQQRVAKGGNPADVTVEDIQRGRVPEVKSAPATPGAPTAKGRRSRSAAPVTCEQLFVGAAR